MTAEPAIRVSHLSKKFSRSLKRAMWYGLVDITGAALIPHRFRSENFSARLSDAEREVAGGKGQERSGGEQEARGRNQGDTAPTAHPLPVAPDGLRPSEFWALRDVSFEVKRGECVGVIGPNGAGKSTLFSVLSGIYGPTEGHVEIRGRLQALIALGAGFHPLLSGRENIYINGAILGMTAAEIDRRLDSILDFAGLGEFIDAPVKTYSSGMLVRLGFSIAAHVDPDVLLIDEVLAVGDAGFQRKCTDFSMRLVNSGKTVVTVSHNLLFIQAMCSRVMWLDKGCIISEGRAETVIDEYRKTMAALSVSTTGELQRRSEGCAALIHEAYWVNERGERTNRVNGGETLMLRVSLEAYETVDCGRVWVQILEKERQHVVAGMSMYDDGHYLRLTPGRGLVDVRIPAVMLRGGHVYEAQVGIRDWLCLAKVADSCPVRPVLVENSAVPCENGMGKAPIVRDTVGAMIHMPYGWAAQGCARLCADVPH